MALVDDRPEAIRAIRKMILNFGTYLAQRAADDGLVPRSAAYRGKT
jgi:hypothetical protein